MPGTRATSAGRHLSMRGLRKRRRAEDTSEVVTFARDGDGDTRRLEALDVGVRAAHDERRAAAPPRVGLQDRAGGPHGDVEERTGAASPGVEDDGDVLTRRVLQLLDHQVPAPCRRAPVHLAQRVALDVVPHAVQVEAARALQEEAAAVARVYPGLREQTLEVDEARIDDECTALGQARPPALEPERILDERDRLFDAVAAARDRRQDVTGPEVPTRAPQLRPALAELGVALDKGDPGRRERRLELELDAHLDVVALERGCRG